MARQNINIGASPGDGTGDLVRNAFDKVNDNFIEVYSHLNPFNETNLQTNTSIVIPAGYMLLSMTFYYNSGSNVVVKVGTTPGGGDIVFNTSVESQHLSLIGAPLNRTGDTTIYVTVQGTSPDIDIEGICVKNRS